MSVNAVGDAECKDGSDRPGEATDLAGDLVADVTGVRGNEDTGTGDQFRVGGIVAIADVLCGGVTAGDAAEKLDLVLFHGARATGTFSPAGERIPDVGCPAVGGDGLSG